MVAEVINPFVMAAYSVFESVLGATPVKGAPLAQRSKATSHQVNVCCGVTGQVAGYLIYAMDLATADRIASAMIGMPVKTFDELAVSAVAELGNMISGNGLLRLSEAGILCDITPPTVIRGRNVEFSTLSVPVLSVPFNTEQGEVVVSVCLQAVK